MHFLEQELEEIRRKNQKIRQLFLSCAVREKDFVRDAQPDELIAWAVDFQKKHNLKVDGVVGPTTLAFYAAEKIFGEIYTDMIVDGQSHSVDFPFLRVFKPGDDIVLTKPRFVTTLSLYELHKIFFNRLLDASPPRSHFSIDASQGNDGHSLVIQWADPCRASEFCPTGNATDYPPNIPMVGIELEGAQMRHQIDVESRKLFRTRAPANEKIQNINNSGYAYFDEQIASYKKLVDFLCPLLDIPNAFPLSSDGTFDTTLHAKFDFEPGIIAKFHYHKDTQPGPGFVAALPSLFNGKRHEPQLEVMRDYLSPNTKRRSAVDENIVNKAIEKERERLANMNFKTQSIRGNDDDCPDYRRRRHKI